ncbi:MAG: DUF2314 domain-containing protein [Gemmataceae bacterium]
MAKSERSKVFLSDDADPEMQRAYAKARANFRYFWREVAWDRRRIVPALQLACVKAPFSDGKDKSKVEQMWLSEVDFDGHFVSGVLLNSPNWLKTVKEGDAARRRLGEISDWMYAIDGHVFGAYTVNLLRSRMGRRERQEHDDAWGLNFGDPAKTRVVPEPGMEGPVLKSWFEKRQGDPSEHPMSVTMASSLRDRLAENPKLASETDARGWTLLHQEALAGNQATVQVLLEAGADPDAITNNDMTALDLAESLGWGNIAELLESRRK